MWECAAFNGFLRKSCVLEAVVEQQHSEFQEPGYPFACRIMHRCLWVMQQGNRSLPYQGLLTCRSVIFIRADLCLMYTEEAIVGVGAFVTEPSPRDLSGYVMWVYGRKKPWEEHECDRYGRAIIVHEVSVSITWVAFWVMAKDPR